MEQVRLQDKPTPDSGFWIGIRNGLIPALALWVLVIWGIVELVDGKD